MRVLLILICGLSAALTRIDPSIPAGVNIDKLVVYKSKREMRAYSKEKLWASYQIALGRHPLGGKKVEGDMKTSEGIYYIHDKNPQSAFHKNLGISYPNARDRAEARKLGKPPGGNVKIHGLQNGYGYLGKLHRLSDWTWGCIAVTNEEMDELYEHVPVGAVIEIYP